jgi:hypothetical protein
MNVCLFVCMYGTYTNSHFWTDLNQTLHMSPPWSGRDRRVCMDPKFLISLTFWALILWGPLQNHGHKMSAGTTVFHDTLISVIPAGVCVTSPTLRCHRWWSHPLQPYICDSSGSSPNIAEMTSLQTTATVLSALFRQVLASRHGYSVQLGDRATCYSIISLILAPVSMTYRKSCPCRQQLCVPTPSVLHCR